MAVSSSPLRDLLKDVEQSVQAYESSQDPAMYSKTLAAIQKLQLAVERPGDVAARMRFQPLQNITLVMLAEMGVLKAIASKEHEKITAEQLSLETGCDSLLIVRLMRLVTAVGIIDEVAEHTYRANAVSDVLSDPGQIAGMKYMIELQGPVGAQIRSFLQSSQYHKTGTADMTACKHAHGKTFWQILDTDSEQRQNFNEYMRAARRGGQVQLWHQRYPPCGKLGVEELKTGDDAVLMVDVGGGVGGQVGAFRKQFPDLPGRCILQDLPETIQKNPSPPEGVECIGYNFFEPQAIKGARIYLFRSVCHDWPDADCHTLLGNTVAAMDPAYSRLLIDEWVLPDSNVDLKAANMDINMMLTFNAMERTISQWSKLLDDIGLEIVDVYRTPGAVESVIETKKKR